MKSFARLNDPQRDSSCPCYVFSKYVVKVALKGNKRVIFCRQVVEKMENVKQIEVKPSGRAEFSLDMKLWDPNSTISLYKVRQDQRHCKN